MKQVMSISKQLVVMSYPKGAFTPEGAQRVKDQLEELGYAVVDVPFNNNTPRPPDFRFLDVVGVEGKGGKGKASTDVIMPKKGRSR